MADRTSAELFAQIFEYLAKQPTTEERDKFAEKMWGLTGNYDFNAYQIGEDEALMKLGLARRGVDPDYPDDGETVLYKGEPGFSRADEH